MQIENSGEVAPEAQSASSSGSPQSEDVLSAEQVIIELATEMQRVARSGAEYDNAQRNLDAAAQALQQAAEDLHGTASAGKQFHADALNTMRTMEEKALAVISSASKEAGEHVAAIREEAVSALGRSEQAIQDMERYTAQMAERIDTRFTRQVTMLRLAVILLGVLTLLVAVTLVLVLVGGS